MPSLISGYEYDIFISYRQKDNKGDRWVSEFVDALKTELESTFKEEISVYFDFNPHDGLLETHDVDASLKEKLKCLIFIPIISRTYCDPNSFAWEHEFRAFVEIASQDQFGLRVKLPNGNVASRVLPVRIYDLNNTDINLFETLVGGVIRGVEFIYSEPGVNRPLKPDDDEKINLKKVKYRNQINKVSNAIHEIVSGLLTEPTEPDKVKSHHKEQSEELRKAKKEEVQEKTEKSSKSLLRSGVVILALLIVTAILVYPKLFKQNKLEKLRSSDGSITVAVMPFQNNTNDSLLDVWQDGIQEILITSLSNSEDLKVQQTKLLSSYLQTKGVASYASVTPSIASEISKKLDAVVFIYGGINQSGSILRLNAQLIDSETEEVIKSFQIDGKSEKIMQTIDSLSVIISNYLILSKMVRGVPALYTSSWQPNTISPDAYRYYLYGTDAYSIGDYTSAKNWFLKSFEIDSAFFLPAYLLSATYWPLGDYDSSKYWCLKVYKNLNDLNTVDQLKINFMYAKCFGTDFEAIKFLIQLTELDKNNVIDLNLLGLNYLYVFQYDKVITVLERALEIYDEWDTKPYGCGIYTMLGKAYHKTGQYKKEKRLYKKAEQDFPDDRSLLSGQAVLSLSEGDTVEANQYIEKYISIRRENSLPEAWISMFLARDIYKEAGLLDKAEAYYRKALSLEPENHIFMNNLGGFLIVKDLNINEGLELVNKALVLSPDHYEYLDTKGLGLFKLERYQEALEIFQKSWDMRLDKAVYRHDAYLNLEVAKKAVAGLKNN